MSRLSTDQIQRIEARLEEAGAVLPCPSCGNAQSTVVDGYLIGYVQSQGRNMVISGDNASCAPRPSVRSAATSRNTCSMCSRRPRRDTTLDETGEGRVQDVQGRLGDGVLPCLGVAQRPGAIRGSRNRDSHHRPRRRSGELRRFAAVSRETGIPTPITTSDVRGRG